MNADGNPNSSDLQLDRYKSSGPKTPAAALNLSRIVWFALLVSQGMYLFLGPILFQDSNSSGKIVEEPPTLVAGLQSQIGRVGGLTAASLLALSFFLPSIILKSQNRLQAKLGGFIIGAAMNEGVALIGFVFGFIFLKNAAFGSALIYFSIAGMLARFPTNEYFAETAEARVG
jgi:hypothetical protein